MLFQNQKLLCIICLLSFFGMSALYAQNFKPFRLLRTIKTEHFDIIFPQESERTAYVLAGFADEVYEETTALLGINLHGRIPVTITPDTDQFNGYMNGVPSPHIVLFDTPIDIDMLWSNENNLRALFLHELTHAISLNSRSPFWEVVNRIFGGGISLTMLNTSQFMVEGVTVSFESLNGFGRANDPLIKEGIRQAIYEKKTLTPFQISGVYDLPANQGAYYEYGGLFSAYIQQRYGMEKYAEWWQLMGAKMPFSFNPYNSGLFRLFKDVYDMSFMDAWKEFLDSLALDTITENSRNILFEKKKSMINVLASSSHELYFGNVLDHALMRYNPQTEKIDTLMPMDPSVYDIAISPDGKTLLLSGFRYKDSLATAVVTEYETSNGRQTGRKWEKIMRGQYFRGGILGLAPDLHNINIVYRSSSGGEEVLLRGTEEISYTTPHAINDTWILYVRALKGVRELCMFNYETKKAYVLHSNLEDDSLRWKYIRNLRVSNDQVMFVYNHDDRMYKLGSFDLSQFRDENSVMNAVFHSADFSGGVFLPAHIDGRIYYRGFFADQDKLMQFPETLSMLSGTKTEIKLVPCEETIPADFAVNNTEPVTEIMPESKPYVGLSYMNPFNFWLPFIPLIRETESFYSLDGWGLMSVMMDPTDTNIISLQAIGDWKAKMADVALSWNTSYFGFPLTLSFADGVDLMYGDNSYRKTQASLSGTFSRSIGNERNDITITGGVAFSISADNPFNNAGAYTWSYDEPLFSGIVGLGWSSTYRYGWERFGTGAAVNLYYRVPFTSLETRLDGTISFAFEKVFPLRFQFYGAWDTKGMDIHGNSRQYDSFFSEAASVEYPSPNNLNVEWITGGQVELKLFSFEIQRNLSHLYFKRIHSTLAYRSVLYDDQGVQKAEGTPIYQDILLAQSLILRLGLDIGIPVRLFQVTFTPSVWGAWKISNMNDEKTNDFAFNVGFDMFL